MNVLELLRAIRIVVETGASPEQYERLAHEARSLADMVGWAQGPIDAQGELLDWLAALQGDITLRQMQTNDMALAMLNDSISTLGRAIANHDSDLNSRRANDEDGEDYF